MPKYQKHLYMILHPTAALVASQLPPELFAKHYTLGSTRHFSEKLIFAEIDIEFRGGSFQIEELLAQTERADGTPKKTKFIATYDVLPRLPLSAIQELFLATSNGQILRLSQSDEDDEPKDEKIRIYQEITPLNNLVASTLKPCDFGEFLTCRSQNVGAPRIFYTQIDMDVAAFLKEGEDEVLIDSPLPGLHPQLLLKRIRDLSKRPEKGNKTVRLGTLLNRISYMQIFRGFWFTDSETHLFYPMPSFDELNTRHFAWMKNA